MHAVSKKITQFEFRLSHQSLVRKMTGNIEAEYQILSPPLGKGKRTVKTLFELDKNIKICVPFIQGGFGEVRKAIHKATGIKRAVKLIKRNALDQEETERLINEVEILKSIVSLTKSIFLYLYKTRNFGRIRKSQSEDLENLLI